jgi:hypothetical protein
VGYSFDHWDLYQGSTESHPTANPLTVIMNADTTAVAHFTPLPTLTVSISPAHSGAVTVNPNRPFYDLGTPVTLTASPTVGYSFDHWDLYQGATESHPTANPLTVIMNADTTAIAHFANPLPPANPPPQVPALSEWGMVAATAVFAISVSAMVLRRRSRGV